MITFEQFKKTMVEMTPTAFVNTYGDLFDTVYFRKVLVYLDGLYIIEKHNGLFNTTIDRSEYEDPNLGSIERRLYQYWKDENFSRCREITDLLHEAARLTAEEFGQQGVSLCDLHTEGLSENQIIFSNLLAETINNIQIIE